MQKTKQKKKNTKKNPMHCKCQPFDHIDEILEMHIVTLMA